MTRDCIELFAGAGAATFGLRAAGLNPVCAVEIDLAVCGVYEANHGPHVLCQGVETVDYRRFNGIPFAWASPSCKQASVANAKGGECEADLTAASAVCRMLREARPRGFCLENVRGYARFRSFAMIRDTLDALGYWTNVSVIDAADMGVPQNRKRLILRACLSGIPAPLPPPVRPWNGWYKAIEDLIPTLPASAFAKWQIDRLSKLFETDPRNILAEGSGCPDMREPLVREAEEPMFTIRSHVRLDTARAYLIEGDCPGERCPTVRPGADPAFTLKAAEGGRVARAFIVEGTAAGEDNLFALPVRSGDEPVFTVRGQNPLRAFLVTNQGDKPNGDPERGPRIFAANEPSGPILSDSCSRTRAWLEQGRVVSLTVRALSRLMGLPDSMILPENRRLATACIGNGVCPAVAEVAARSVLEGME